MDIKPVGRPRSRTKKYPPHINPSKIPDRCYWDSSGNGHWYTTIKDDVTGKRRRQWLAGPSAQHSDLHRAMERAAAKAADNLDWLGQQFIDSPQYKQVSTSQQKSYTYGFEIIKTQPTLEKGVTLGQVPISDWDTPMVQRVIDKVAVERGPSSAKKVYEYLRRLFNWAILRGLYRQVSPVAKKMELPKERQRRRNPPHDVLASVIVFAFERAQLDPHTAGSCPAYIWKALILTYETRLRGVEAFDMSDASLVDDGVLCGRRKGSNTNIARWNNNLRICVNAALATRSDIWERNGRPIPLRPEHRPLLVNENGDPVTQSGWQSAWRRFMDLAVREKVITDEQRFGLHDMKRRGTTDTKGTKLEKLSAVGLSNLNILKVYDHSVEVVCATTGDR